MKMRLSQMFLLLLVVVFLTACGHSVSVYFANDNMLYRGESLTDTDSHEMPRDEFDIYGEIDGGDTYGGYEESKTTEWVSEYIRDKIDSAKSENADTVGYLWTVDGKIDFPVLQTNDNDYYLHHDFYRNATEKGAIFADFRNTPGTRYENDRNTIIYGHNHTDDKEDGEMFAMLMNYTDIEFAQNNQIINLATEYDNLRFLVFAAFYSDVEFYYINNAPSDEDFRMIVDEAKERSEFIFPTDVDDDDKILTLSTCTFKYDTEHEQRFVVMAKLLPPDFEPEFESVAVNPSPKEPSFVAVG